MYRRKKDCVGEQRWFSSSVAFFNTDEMICVAGGRHFSNVGMQWSYIVLGRDFRSWCSDSFAVVAVPIVPRADLYAPTIDMRVLNTCMLCPLSLSPGFLLMASLSVQ